MNKKPTITTNPLEDKQAIFRAIFSKSAVSNIQANQNAHKRTRFSDQFYRQKSDSIVQSNIAHNTGRYILYSKNKYIEQNTQILEMNEILKVTTPSTKWFTKGVQNSGEPAAQENIQISTEDSQVLPSSERFIEDSNQEGNKIEEKGQKEKNQMLKKLANVQNRFALSRYVIYIYIYIYSTHQNTGKELERHWA